MSFPTSCDTFVCLPLLTKDDAVIFGKNSDRPSEEVQEIVYFPQKSHPDGSKVSCTYIEIPQVSQTHAVILSKPSWMWGAEMGANSCGVCIGNEAVWVNVEATSDKKLLGMDLLRLALERSKTAQEALKVITTLLQRHGQGGPCSDTDSSLLYHNSYLITDSKEAWVLETIGDDIWAAEKVTSGFRNISNCLSIRTKIDEKSEGLEEKALELGYWKKGTEFNFSKVFSSGGPCGRYTEGMKLLSKETKDKLFDAKRMMSILRDEESGICMGGYDLGGSSSTSSQVSVIKGEGNSVHWFTGTPDPDMSVFKPFLFSKANKDSTNLTESPSNNTKDRRHPLYKAHQAAYTKKICRDAQNRLKMKNLEESLFDKVEKIPSTFDNSCCTFNEAVKSEIKLYD